MWDSIQTVSRALDQIRSPGAVTCQCHLIYLRYITLKFIQFTASPAYILHKKYSVFFFQYFFLPNTHFPFQFYDTSTSGFHHADHLITAIDQPSFSTSFNSFDSHLHTWLFIGSLFFALLFPFAFMYSYAYFCPCPHRLSEKKTNQDIMASLWLLGVTTQRYSIILTC